MPEYLDGLNRHSRFQLTLIISEFGQAIVAISVRQAASWSASRNESIALGKLETDAHRTSKETRENLTKTARIEKEIPRNVATTIHQDTKTLRHRHVSRVPGFNYEQAVKRAADWLTKAEPRTTDERAFKLLGLGWAGVKADNEIIRKSVGDLLREQRPDGGWSQISTLASDAYATGQALVALRQAGGLPVNDPAFRRGIEFLLKTQLEDGSWYVKSRAIPLQPFFESGFPHGQDQWISAAATNWASMALALTGAPPKK